MAAAPLVLTNSPRNGNLLFGTKNRKKPIDIFQSMGIYCRLHMNKCSYVKINRQEAAIMEKQYILENLGCAHSAAQIEEMFNALPEVEKATIVFVTRQLRLTAGDPDSLIPKLQQLAQTAEPEVTIRSGEEHHEECHNGECHCHGQTHHHHHHHHEEENELPGILLGAGLFGAGLVLQWLLPQFPAALILYLALLCVANAVRLREL